MAENEMIGWQALGDGEGQGSRVCCSPWGCKESDVTERLNKQQILGDTCSLEGKL